MIIGFDDASMTAMFALKKANKSLVDLDRQIYEFSNIARYSRQMLSNSTRKRFGVEGYYMVDLTNLNIATLCGWDFNTNGIDYFDVSQNKLLRVFDKETDFGTFVGWIDLSRNGMCSVDFGNTIIEILDLSNNNLTNLASIVFPLKWNEIFLCDNPIAMNGVIENHEFPNGFSLKMERCGIATLENVLFHSKHVWLSNNPRI